VKENGVDDNHQPEVEMQRGTKTDSFKAAGIRSRDLLK
jgi:hypothetical protein